MFLKILSNWRSFFQIIFDSSFRAKSERFQFSAQFSYTNKRDSKNTHHYKILEI